MKQRVSFTIPGRISGWKRAGRNLKQSFTPAKMRSDQGIVKHFASQAMRGRELLAGPLSIVIVVFRLPAKSWSKKKQAAARWVTGTPDLDNIAKLINDALNGVVWRDDAQLAQLQVARMYRQGGVEHVNITVECLEVV